MNFESVQSFKYLGSVVNQNNIIEEEIKERLIRDRRRAVVNAVMNLQVP